MQRTFLSILVLLLLISVRSNAQCLTPPAAPVCTGTEPLLIENDTLKSGISKWYYGPTVTLNTITIRGGTLTVCGNLTIDKLYMDSGTLFVRPGARLVIASGIGAGLQFKGGCAIYNYGTFELQRNLTLENPATAASPNIVVNATNSSIFKMSNQYFVISNAFSKFVNNGQAEFWGIITDVQSTSGSVCLGDRSLTKMAVLINKVANTYTAPSGNACVNVYQYSEFYGQLTTTPTLFACLGSGHTSNSGCIPFGCTPNNWGAAQVFTGCAGCGAIAALSVEFVSFNGYSAHNTNKLEWQINTEARAGNFQIERSPDGINFSVIDSISILATTSTFFNIIDKNPLPGNNYYMIRYNNSATGSMIDSKMVKVYTEPVSGFDIYPVPFENQFFISHDLNTRLEKIILTDVNGRNISIRYQKKDDRMMEINVLDKLQSGIYIVHLRTDKQVVARTVFKK